MVKVQQAVPLAADGHVDVGAWIARVHADHPHLGSEKLLSCGEWLKQTHPEILHQSVELATLVADLKMDEHAVLAGLIYRAVRGNRLDHDAAAALAGSQAAAIVIAVAAMATTSLLDMSDSTWLEKEREDQVENVKRMLVAMIDDARVAVVKLAERVLALRRAKEHDGARRLRIAKEARAIFAPLAGRLGIWQLKWELEDLSFRYTQPHEYQQIARRLKGKRGEREAQVMLMVDQVRAVLRGHGVEAEVFGRAKNIYSIYRKMRAKNVSFEQVHDVRAVRVVVATLADCYAALGVIHTTWEHIPAEFDDYIANPKENGYRSIHTAVTASDGRTLEIQIRTQAMHQDAELGVCAHWNYKGEFAESPDYSSKMEWMRQVMEWHEELAGAETLGTLLRHSASAARIYVSTPKGHVLDLPAGATVIDFAYRVHTDVGHSCVGGTVNGQAVHLNRVLRTGEHVAIRTVSGHKPDRAWLEPELGYVITDRARAKLTSYFRALSDADKRRLGREVLLRLFAALGWPQPETIDVQEYLAHLRCADLDALYQQVGGASRSFIETAHDYVRHGGWGEQPFLPGLRATDRTVLKLKVTGENRDGLLRDMTEVIGALGLSLSGTTGRVSNPSGQAIITLEVSLEGWRETLILVSHLLLVDGVLQVAQIE